MDFLTRVNDVSSLQSISGLLTWDQSTHMPSGGADLRAKNISVLSQEIHRKLVDPAFGQAARTALNSEDPRIRRAAKYWLESHTDALRVPEKLVSDLASAASLSENRWYEATTFSEMVPYLDRLIKLDLEYAACFPEKDPYDTMVDCFDPGLRQTYLDKQFAVLRPGLLDLRSRAGVARPKLLKPSSSEGALLDFCRKITASIGYDYNRGNLTTTAHPFMQSMGPEDARIATYLKPGAPLDTILGAIHEAGHAIYEQGAGWADLGITNDSSALHESQSLFYEVMLGKSTAFWDKNLPDLNSILDLKYPSPSELIHDLRRYDPTNVIRLQAGDLDYGLHILLRYDIERALFSGQIEAKGMRDMFNDLSISYFGRAPKDDRKEGVLQDIHWAANLFGYFPSYLLGVSFAAQLWGTCPDKENPKAIQKFLHSTVHQHGGAYSFEEVTDMAGGYDPTLYLSYLKSAYGI